MRSAAPWIGAAALALCACGAALGGEGTDLHLTYSSGADGTVQPFRLYVPSVNDGQHALPLVITLHGTGGNENTMFDEYGSGAMKRAAEKAGVLLVSPRGDLASEFRGLGEYDVLSVLEEVRSRYLVDPARIYLTGHSMGATGSAYLALHHPDLFAAAAPLAAAYGFPWLARNARAVPMLFIGGADDTEAYLRGVMPGLERMLKFGAHVKFELLPGQGHRGPVQDFDHVFEWLLKQRRDLHPQAYVFEVDTPLHGRAFWTTVERLETPGEPGCVEAEVVQEDNGARFRLHGVKTVAFAPDAKVFDLARPIAVSIDGEPRWKGPLTGSQELLLERGDGDWTAEVRPRTSHAPVEWRTHPVAEAPETLDMTGEEKRLGNWIADAMRAATGAEVALYSPVYYRGLPILKGTVDLVDLIQCSRPFDQYLVTVELTQKEIEEILTANLKAAYPAIAVDRPGAGRLVQVSGFRYRYGDHRVTSDLGGAPTYTVALEGQVVERETMLLGGLFKKLDYRTTDIPFSLALYRHAVATGRIEAPLEGRIRKGL